MRGALKLPGDKSISHRAAMLASLAEGETRVENFSTSRDCASTLQCMSQLGAQIRRDENCVTIEGVGLKGLRQSSDALDCGNSGSTMRMLAGVLAGQNFVSTLIGDESLSKRPMRRIIAPLEQMGARVESTEGHAPLKICGKRPLSAISYQLPVASAQVKSCVLLAGLFADSCTEVVEPRVRTRDHTERMLRWFGVEVETQTHEVEGARSHVAAIAPPFKVKAREYAVPGDISSATFFIAAAALLPGSQLTLQNVGLNPTRASLLEVMRQLGANLRVVDARERCNEPVGDIEISGAKGLRESETSAPHTLRGEGIAGLIDELPMLAVVGSQLPCGLEIRDAAELRVKESDRIRATIENLRRMGAEVEEHADGMTVRGGAKLKGARLESYGDHRIAMAFSVAALAADGESEIVGADCVAVSFPEFYETLESIIER